MASTSKTRVRLEQTLMSQLYIDALAETGYTAKLVNKGPVPPPRLRITFKKVKYEVSVVEDESELPFQVRQNLAVGRDLGIPFKAILIAHEVPPPKPEDPPKPQETIKPAPVASPMKEEKTVVKEQWHIDMPRLLKNVLFWLVVPPVVLVVVVLTLPYILAAMKLIAVLGLGVLGLAVLGMVGVGADPLCLVILQDGSWILIGQWYQ